MPPETPPAGLTQRLVAEALPGAGEVRHAVPAGLLRRAAHGATPVQQAGGSGAGMASVRRTMPPLTPTVVRDRAGLLAWREYELSNQRACADYALRMDAATYTMRSARARHRAGQLRFPPTSTPYHPGNTP